MNNFFWNIKFPYKYTFKCVNYPYPSNNNTSKIVFDGTHVTKIFSEEDKPTMRLIVESEDPYLLQYGGGQNLSEEEKNKKIYHLEYNIDLINSKLNSILPFISKKTQDTKIQELSILPSETAKEYHNRFNSEIEKIWVEMLNNREKYIEGNFDKSVTIYELHDKYLTLKKDILKNELREQLKIFWYDTTEKPFKDFNYKEFSKKITGIYEEQKKIPGTKIYDLHNQIEELS